MGSQNPETSFAVEIRISDDNSFIHTVSLLKIGAGNPIKLTLCFWRVGYLASYGQR